MPRGVNHPREDWQEQRSARVQARKGRVQWVDLKFVETSHGFYRHLKVTHLPTGVAAEAEGYHVGKHELRDRIFPVLVRAVQRYRPDKEPEATLSGVNTEVPDGDPERPTERLQDDEAPEEPADE